MISLEALFDKHMSAVEPKYGLITHIKALGLMVNLLSVKLAGGCITFGVLTWGRPIWQDPARRQIGRFSSV
jgi:hypothetical protein